MDTLGLLTCIPIVRRCIFEPAFVGSLAFNKNILTAHLILEPGTGTIDEVDGPSSLVARVVRDGGCVNCIEFQTYMLNG